MSDIVPARPRFVVALVALAVVIAGALSLWSSPSSGAAGCPAPYGHCKVSSPQLTVRDHDTRLVIGNIYANTPIKVTRRSQHDGRTTGLLGYIGGNFHHCGWVHYSKTATADRKLGVHSDCADISAKSYASLIDCDRCNAGTRGTYRLKVRPGVFTVYDNAPLFGRAIMQKPIGTVHGVIRRKNGTIKSRGDSLSWRYVSKNGQWMAVVLGDDLHNTDNDQGRGWGFISTAALVAKPKDYCKGRKPVAAHSHADYPPVCQLGAYHATK